MKKLLFILLLSPLFSMAQDKPKDAPAKADTTIAIQMKLDQFKALLYAIDANIDSKKVSKELLDFLQKSAQIVQPKDKPKQ